MKQTLRLNTFETNSSSTHSCCLCSEEELKGWKEGKLYFIRWSRDEQIFIEKSKVDEEWEEFKRSKDYESHLIYNDNDEEEAYQSWLKDSDYTSYDDFGYDHETEETERTIDDKKYYAVCYYGYDY